MNYEQARQRSADGKWAWTTMNDGRISTAGGCVTWPEGPPLTVEEAIGPDRKPMGEPHAHETREEAERCHWHWELGRVRLEQLDLATLRERRRCDVSECPEWEDYRTRWHDGYRTDSLCTFHATHQTVVELHPFVPGMQVIHL